jgi:hypothetical protein
MTVSSTTASQTFSCNGATVAFTCPFRVLAAEEMQGFLILVSTGAQTALTNGVDFTVAGAGTAANAAVTTSTTYSNLYQVKFSRATARVQATDYRDNDPFPAESHETALDRLTMIAQELDADVGRTIRTPAGESIPELPPASVRAGKQYLFDANGDPLLSAPANGSAAALALLLAGIANATEGAGMVGASAAIDYVQGTLGWRAYVDGVCVGDFPWAAAGDCADNEYTAITTAGTDDAASIQAAIASVSVAGGGYVCGVKGKKYRCTVSPIIKPGVLLRDITIILDLSGAASEGIKLRTGSHMVRTKVRAYSSGAPGSQAGIHACVTVGALYSNGGTVAAPSADESVSRWSIEDCDLWGNGAGKSVIQVNGGANAFRITGNYFPDNAYASIAIGLDWGYVGTLDTSSDAGIVAGKVAFLAGTMYTTHPHNCTISRNKIGAMTYAASHGIRLSGVYDVTVEDNELASSTYAGFYHTAGDAGFEFAPVAVKPYRHKGIRVARMNVMAANNGWGYFSDCYADNVASAVANVAYVNLLSPIQEIDIVFEQCRTKGGGTGAAIAGFRMQNQIGGRAIDCEATGHEYGGLIETGSEDVYFIRGRYYGNVKDGIKIDHPTVPPKNCRVLDVETYGNGATYAGVHTGTCTRPVVRSCKLGRAAGETQTNGVRADAATVAADIQDNYSYGVAGGGVHYSIAGSTDYAVLDVFADNDNGAGTAYGGVNIIPYAKGMHPTGTNRPRRFRALRVTLTGDISPPAAFASVVGDLIDIIDPTADGAHYGGSLCTVAGSSGTWKGVGIVSA